MREWMRKTIVPMTSLWMQRWLETLIISALFIGLSYYWHHNDPFFLRGSFPWVLLAPLMITLRYGFWCGIGSNIILVAALLYLEPAAVLNSVNYYYYILGMALLTFIAGEFNDSCIYRMTRAQQLNSYARERLNNLTRAYYVLKLSHDRLEQSVVTKPISLRKIFADMRKLLFDSRGLLTAITAKRLLNLLEQYCYLTKASIYKVEQGKPDSKPIAYMGNEEQLNAGDILVEQALTREGANYSSINQLDGKQISDYLVVAPLRTSTGQVLALLVIKEMSFWTLNDDTLQIIYALISFFADEIWATREAAAVVTKYPSCPLIFASAMYKMRRLYRELKIESALVAFVVPKKMPHARRLLVSLEKEQRTLDFTWIYHLEERVVLMVLKPFFMPSRTEEYVIEIETKLPQEDVSLFYQQTGNVAPLTVIDELLRKII